MSLVIVELRREDNDHRIVYSTVKPKRMNTITMNTNTSSDNTTDSSGSIHHSPVLIPIAFQSAVACGDSTHPDDTACGKGDTHPHGKTNPLQEWAMIEINGELLLPSPLSSNNDGTSSSSSSSIFDSRTNVELGSISFETCQSATSSSASPKQAPVVPIMIIGTHELRGSIIELPQPFLCLQKHVRGAVRNQNHPMGIIDLTENEMDDVTDRNDTKTTTTTEYFVRGIVKYKFIFNQYPKTIMR
jgi:Ctf8